jgi:anionic cell wall polymer biosynthesis LytR-Cps2A-Psr (LCP) family protein
MVDAIGGVPMNVPEQTTDKWIGMVIEAGQHTLNGSQVEAYARAIPDSDFGRIQRDNLLVEALRQKLSDPSVWVKIPQLYEQFKDVIVTDLSPQQIINLGCLMKSTPKESILQDEVKSEWTTAGPQGSLLWDSTKVSARLKELGLIQ